MIKYVFYLLYSILMALFAMYVAKYIDKKYKQSNHFKKGKKIRLFFIEYPWITAIASFSLFILLEFLKI